MVGFLKKEKIWKWGEKMSDIPFWVTWGIVAGVIGFIIGLATFFWQLQDRQENWRKRPQLEIIRYDIWNGRWVALDGGRFAKFHCLQIKNNGTIPAKRCVAKLKIIAKPNTATNLDLDEEYKLHWADIDYSYRTDEPEPIDLGSESRRLDVFFSQLTNSPSLPTNGI